MLLFYCSTVVKMETNSSKEKQNPSVSSIVSNTVFWSHRHLIYRHGTHTRAFKHRHIKEIFENWAKAESGDMCLGSQILKRLNEPRQ